MVTSTLPRLGYRKGSEITTNDEVEEPEPYLDQEVPLHLKKNNTFGIENNNPYDFFNL